MAEVKAKDLKVGDVFCYYSTDGCKNKITAIDPAIRITFDYDYKNRCSHLETVGYFQPESELELVDPPKPETYTVVDIKIGELVEFEGANLKGAVVITNIETSDDDMLVLTVAETCNVFFRVTEAKVRLEKNVPVKEICSPFGCRAWHILIPK